MLMHDAVVIDDEHTRRPQWCATGSPRPGCPTSGSRSTWPGAMAGPTASWSPTMGTPAPAGLGSSGDRHALSMHTGGPLWRRERGGDAAAAAAARGVATASVALLPADMDSGGPGG